MREGVWGSDMERNRMKKLVRSLLGTGKTAVKACLYSFLQNSVLVYQNDFLAAYRESAVLPKILEKGNEDECLRQIAKWYKKVCPKKRLGKQEIFNQLKKKTHRKRKWTNRVIVIVENVSPRSYKIVKALHNQGIPITLIFGRLSAKGGKEEALRRKLKEVSDTCYDCFCMEEMMYRVLMENASVIHWFTAWSDLTYSYFFLKQKELFGKKIVIDRYDILNGLYTGIDEKWLHMERYVMENADGICNRSFEIPFLKEKMRFSIKGKVILFFDYIEEGECPAVSQKGSTSEGELSIVYAGGVGVEREDPTIPWACFLEFAEICRKNTCHFHVYPANWDAKRYVDLIGMDRKNPYFHFHHPIPFTQLIKKMAEYDYAVLPSRRLDGEKEVYGYNTKYKFQYAATNKYFDAVEAGIPFISKLPKQMSDMFAEQGLCVPWTIEEYDFDYLCRNKKELRERVRSQRENWFIEKHMEELLLFYKSL